MTKEKGSVCQTDRISERSSGIELLKVIAIVLIVLFHMTQTYTSMSDLSVGQDYHDDLSTAFVSARHILLIIFAVIGQAGIILINNFLESKFNYPNSRTLRWSMTNSNPLYIVAAIAALFLVRTSAFHSRTINYISSLSMLIYIVHENILIKAYYRPRAISYVYSLLGGDHMLLGLFLLTAAMLALSLAVSAVYGLFLRKHVRALSERIFEVCKKSVARIEDAILKLR